jgi:hypothetical protein
VVSGKWDDEIVLGRPGAMLAFGPPEYWTDGSKLVRIPLRVSADGLEARTHIELEAWGRWIPGFHAYLDDLDREWRGWDGVKEWSDDGHNVTLGATHRSALVATLTVSLTGFPGQDGVGEWVARAVVPLESAQLSRLAHRVHDLLSAAPWNVGSPDGGG